MFVAILLPISVFLKAAAVKPVGTACPNTRLEVPRVGVVNAPWTAIFPLPDTVNEPVICASPVNGKVLPPPPAFRACEAVKAYEAEIEDKLPAGVVKYEAETYPLALTGPSNIIADPVSSMVSDMA